MYLEFPRTQHLDKGRRDKDGYICIASIRGLKTRPSKDLFLLPSFCPSIQFSILPSHFIYFILTLKTALEGHNLRKGGLFYFLKLKEPLFFSFKDVSGTNTIFSVENNCFLGIYNENLHPIFCSGYLDGRYWRLHFSNDGGEPCRLLFQKMGGKPWTDGPSHSPHL